MNTVTLELLDDSNAVAATISAQFDSTEIALLENYSELMDRVKEAAILKRGFSGIIGMKWNADEGMVFTCAPYTNSELYELLHVLRPVMLEEERASFKKVLSLLGRKFNNKTFAKHQHALRALFEEGQLSSYMQISIGNQKLFHNSVLWLWLNGTQYHSDHEKQVAWQELENSITSENARALAIEQIHSRVKALLLLERIVRLILRKNAA